MKIQDFAFACLLVMVSTFSFADSVVEVVPVYNRPASEIQPLLLPLLESSDRIVANGDSLIVKTLPGRLQEITTLIRKLDNPLNNLLISVIQSRDTTAEQLNSETGIDIHIPNQGSSHLGPQDGGHTNQFEARIYHQQGQINSTHNNRNTQTIRTVEGASAHIKVGNTYPVTSNQVFTGAYGFPGVTQSTQLVEASTGFEVTPRLVGQQVVMDVSPWSDKFNGRGQMQTQEANTTIRVNLGEWVDLGGIDESGQYNGNSSFAYRRQTRQNNLHILVKVDLVN